MVRSQSSASVSVCKAAGFFDRLFPECTDRARDHGDRIQVGERLTIEILTADVFDRLPLREQVHLVSDLHIACDRADNALAGGRSFSSRLFRAVLVIAEMHNQSRDGIRQQFGIRIDTDDKFRVRPADPIVQCRCLSSVRFRIDLDLRVIRKSLADPLIGGVGAAVIDKDDLEIGIVGVQQALDRADRIDLFVVSRER